EDVKTKRAPEYPLSGELSERMDLYLNQFRRQFRGSEKHTYLWASNRGRPTASLGRFDDARARRSVFRSTCIASGVPGRESGLAKTQLTSEASRTCLDMRPSAQPRRIISWLSRALQAVPLL